MGIALIILVIDALFFGLQASEKKIGGAQSTTLMTISAVIMAMCLGYIILVALKSPPPPAKK